MLLWNRLIDYLEMTGKKKEIERDVRKKRERIKRVAYTYEFVFPLKNRTYMKYFTKYSFFSHKN